MDYLPLRPLRIEQSKGARARVNAEIPCNGRKINLRVSLSWFLYAKMTTARLSNEFLALCLIRAVWERLQWKEVARIMNAIFKATTKPRKTVLFRDKTVSMQFSDLSRACGRGRHGIWSSICGNAQDEIGMIVKIRDAAARLEIKLLEVEVSLLTPAGNKANHKQVARGHDSIVEMELDQFLSSTWTPPSPAMRILLHPTVAPENSSNTRLGRPGLFFRYQSQLSGSVSFKDGSICALKCLDAVIAPPPYGSKFFLVEAATHLQRLKGMSDATRKNDILREEYIPTAFLSITESFIDAFRRSYEAWHKDGRDSEIIITSSESLYNKASVYRADHILNLLRETKSVDPQKIHMYRGKFERLVWGQIPADTVFRRVRFSSIIKLANKDSSVNKVLRLVKEWGTLSTSKAREGFRSTPLKMSKEIATAMGKLVKLLGLQEAGQDCLSHMVYNIIQNFMIAQQKERGRQILADEFIAGLGKDSSDTRQGFEQGCQDALRCK
jgi:hypothetical protein